jgi:hypothetical protein
MPATTAEQVILELVRNAGGQWVGKKKLHKAFYLAHLFYAAERPGVLTDWPIARLPEGPGIHDARDLFGRLLEAGSLTVEEVRVGPYPEHSFRLTDKGPPQGALPEDARRAVRQAAEFAIPLSGYELSEITHEYSRSWRRGADGDLLNIYIDLIPDDEFENNEQQLAGLEQALRQAWGNGP